MRTRYSTVEGDVVPKYHDPKPTSGMRIGQADGMHRWVWCEHPKDDSPPRWYSVRDLVPETPEDLAIIADPTTLPVHPALDPEEQGDGTMTSHDHPKD